jgi:hypothetical protein
VHDRDGLAKIEIHLRSSLRLLWMGLRWERGQTIVKTLIDGPADDCQRRNMRLQRAVPGLNL